MSPSPPPPPQTQSQDQALEPETFKEVSQAQRFPCEQCGADYRFDPQSHRMICAHCGHQADFDLDDPAQGQIREIDFKSAQSTTLSDDNMESIRTSSCPNCAAKVSFDTDIHAKECPFCATPVAADTGTHKQHKPRAVLPFSIDERAAKAAMNEWLGSLWFAPNGLQDYARKGRKLQGIYVPYWTFDADTKTAYTGERGTVYYETRTVTRNGKTMTERVQRIRWSYKSGRVKRWFDDVLVLASKSLPPKHTEALEPWSLGDLKPFSSAYLSGFLSESYIIYLDEGYDRAQEKKEAVIRRDVRFDIGGDRQRIHNMETDISDVTFKHILLPVWMAAYKFRGESYRFVVNGQTGRVQGERPWSFWKIAFAVLLGLCVAGALGYAAAYYEQV